MAFRTSPIPGQQGQYLHQQQQVPQQLQQQQQQAGLQGRSSPMPPVPSLTQNNVGQPGALASYQNGAGEASSSSSSSSYGQSDALPHNGGGEGNGAMSDKGPDYVYFERKPAQLGETTTGKAMAAKMKLELFYKEAVESVVGRKERYVGVTLRSTIPGRNL